MPTHDGVVEHGSGVSDLRAIGHVGIAAELRGRRWLGVELGDCQPIVDRLSDLDAERQQLRGIRSEINTLFTADTLALRAKFGHDTSRYRLLPELEVHRNNNGSQPAADELSQSTLPLHA